MLDISKLPEKIGKFFAKLFGNKFVITEIDVERFMDEYKIIVRLKAKTAR